MRRVSTKFRAIALASFLLAIGAGAILTGSAHASYIGNCASDGVNPAAVVVSSTGVKVSKGVGVFRCGSSRVLQVQVQLWGDDAIRDDLLANSTGTFTMSPGVSRTIGSSAVACNEDSPGADELYSRVRARIYIGSGVYTTWSAWDPGATVTYSC